MPSSVSRRNLAADLGTRADTGDPFENKNWGPATRSSGLWKGFVRCGVGDRLGGGDRNRSYYLIRPELYVLLYTLYCALPGKRYHPILEAFPFSPSIESTQIRAFSLLSCSLFPEVHF